MSEKEPELLRQMKSIEAKRDEHFRLGVAIYHGVKDYLINKFPDTDVAEDVIKKEGYSIRVERAKSKRTENDNILVGFESLSLNKFLILTQHLDLVFRCSREELDTKLALVDQKGAHPKGRLSEVEDLRQFKELVDILTEDDLNVQTDRQESVVGGHEIAG